MNATFRHVLIVLTTILLFSNCAKRGTPSGGPKDSIPPMIIRSSPENFTTHFTGDEIRIYFDEYIKLKDLQQNLIISPPLEYQPIITPLNTSKVLKIKILDTLKENTTYSFNFGKSIVDNNEENEFEYYKYIFSTGDYIDSLTVKGKIEDALLARPDKPTTILLYEITESFNDSIIYSEKPTYITTTRDSTQTFELTNLKEGNFLLIALQEEINNYTFEPKKDKIGFIDGVISTPNDSTYTLSLFKEIPTYKIARPSHASKHKIIFGYDGVGDAIELTPITELPSNFTSTVYWDSQTDSLNYYFKPAIDIEQTDTLYFLAKNKLVTDTLIVKMRDLFADSLLVSRVGATVMIPRDTLKLGSNNPIISINSEKIKVMDKDSVAIPFTTSLNKKYNIASILFPKTELQQYRIELLPEALIDYFENTNDTLNYGVRTLELSDYGELGMTLQNVEQYPIIVELVSSKYKVVASQYLTENAPLYFNYLSPDKYYFRVIFDENENGKWDTGSFLDKRQPETVIYFPKKIDIRSNFFINESFTLE
ncbi:MAG: Ig-like domain-containing protein [Flavobacteriaceae bacterium]|nr:Ig-like domain-containing protein [Flavobacteriaceae bacterium]